jgi:hypothetical protein
LVPNLQQLLSITHLVTGSRTVLEARSAVHLVEDVK